MRCSVAFTFINRRHHCRQARITIDGCTLNFFWAPGCAGDYFATLVHHIARCKPPAPRRCGVGVCVAALAQLYTKSKPDPSFSPPFARPQAGLRACTECAGKIGTPHGKGFGWHPDSSSPGAHSSSPSSYKESFSLAGYGRSSTDSAASRSSGVASPAAAFPASGHVWGQGDMGVGMRNWDTSGGGRRRGRRRSSTFNGSFADEDGLCRFCKVQ